MSLSSISSQLPRTVEQNQHVDHRIQANQGNGSCYSTTQKVMAVVAGVIASVGALVLGGPIVGLVVALICGTGLLALFNSCCPSHNIFGSRFMNGNPPPGGGHHHHGHVPPGGGQNPYVPGHVVVGGGHAPGHGRAPVGAGHVPVGGGHAPGHGRAPVGAGHVPVGAGHAPGHGHAPVGGGHIPGHRPTDTPPPSGPGGHVPVGRGHR